MYPVQQTLVVPDCDYVQTRAGDLVQQALSGALTGTLDADLYTGSCHSEFTPDQQGDGIGAVEAWADSIHAALGPITVDVVDQYELGATGSTPVRVATHARLNCTSPRGTLELSLIAHHHLVDGKIDAQWLTYDELNLAHHGIALSSGTGDA